MPQIRGLVTYADVLYMVRDAGFFSIDSAGRVTTLGTLNSTSGPVDFSSNLTQLVINDGAFLYVYGRNTGLFTTASGYSGGDRIAFLDQRVFFLTRGTQQFGWTALGDATSIQPLSFASAERSPDLLVSIAAVAGDLWLFGATSTEVWQSTGDSAVVGAQRAAGIEYGCAAAFSVANLSNSLAWLARDERGQAIVLKASGYQPQRISTRAIEERFTGLDVSQARAYAYSEGGQQFYVLSCPGVPTTLVWDDTFGQWHERAELVGGVYAPWRATTHAFAYGQHFFGADDATIYTSSKDWHRYGTDPKVRERVSPVISLDNRRSLNFASFEIVCEKATTGQVMLRFSADNGATWSDWRTESAGNVGEYARLIRFNRLGSAFDRVYQVRMADNAPFNPVAVNVVAK
jgi:hypothetical protein